MGVPHRDGNGKFLPGNPGGPGRPRRAVEADYLVAMSEEVSLPEWRGIVRKAVEQATAGDSKSREWLGAYLLGTPTGDALLRAAAAELSGFDAVAAEAHELTEQESLQVLIRDLKSSGEG